MSLGLNLALLVFFTSHPAHSENNYSALDEDDLNVKLGWSQSNDCILKNPTKPRDDPIIDTDWNDDYRFELFNRNSPIEGIPISVKNSSKYLRSIFIPGRPLKVVTHGWLGSEDSTVVVNTSMLYVAKQDVNAIGVGWAEWASQIAYPISAGSVPLVAKHVRRLVEKLLRLNITTLESTHLIGHSLGAHIMGIAGACIRRGKVARITGLDPAGPGFEHVTSAGGRLDYQDAHFVDVIHTSAGTAGFYSPMGHADFYPNGGYAPQPGCETIALWNAIVCSHSRSWMLNLESIENPLAFKAVRCESWADFRQGHCSNNFATYMGDTNYSNTRDTFYLKTNDTSPFGLGAAGVSIY